MSFRLTLEESYPEGLRRIAIEQVDRAIGDVTNRAIDRGESIHQVRKRCKKIRAVLRLIRPCIDDYSTENRRFRNLADKLSNARDAEVLLETLSELLDRHDGGNAYPKMSKVADFLRENLRAQVAQLDERGIDQAYLLKRLREGREALSAVAIQGDGDEIWSGGFKKTYRRARKALEEIEQSSDPTGDDFHELRKRAKYHWHHLRILRDIWPKVLNARSKEADALASLLGDHHDLIVLRDFVDQERDRIEADEEVERLHQWVGDGESKFAQQALPLAGRLFAEKPGAIAKRMAAYAEVWRESACRYHYGRRQAVTAFPHHPTNACPQ